MCVIKAIIAGSRKFDDYDLLDNICKKYLKTFLDSGFDIDIISGRALGADRLGERYALRSGFKLTTFDANWNKYGKVAGYKRNLQMRDYALEDCNLPHLFAFWDGKSKGTEHMIRVCKDARFSNIYVINYIDRVINHTLIY